MRDMYPQANGGPRGKLGAFADGTPGGVHKEAEMSAPAGWHPDPYGRFAKRYWDGQQWTEHVVTGDERQQVDPMGTSTAIPFATPESAQTTRRQPDGDGSASPGHGFAATSSAVDPGGAPATAPARPDGGGFWGLLARMAPDSRTRPDPTLPIVLSGLGGVLAGGGIAALVIGDSSTRAKVVIAGVVITALCLVVRLAVPRPAEVRSAAIGGGIVGLAVLAAGIVGDGFTDNDWVPAAVIAALFLAAWALPGFFGRTVMLGIGTFAVVAAVAAAIDNDPVDPDARSVNVDVPFFDRIGNQGYVFMVLGAALMGLVYLLDRRGFRGTATGLVAAGLSSTGLGLAALVTEFGETGGPLLSVMVGGLVCFVGSNGARRATTWTGALITAVAVAALVANLLEPASSGEVGLVGLLSAAALVAVSVVAARRRAARQPADPAVPAG